jgi:hypothetical protein
MISSAQLDCDQCLAFKTNGHPLHNLETHNLHFWNRWHYNLFEEPCIASNAIFNDERNYCNIYCRARMMLKGLRPRAIFGVALVFTISELHRAGSFLASSVTFLCYTIEHVQRTS